MKKGGKVKRVLNRILNFFSPKVLAWIILIMSILGLYNYLLVFIQIRYIHLGFLISLLGIISSILIFNKKRWGLILGIIWTAVQIPILQIGNFVLNLSQFLQFHISITDINTTFKNISINLLAILILYFLIRNLKNQTKIKT